jgi:hypothetical protein
VEERDNRQPSPDRDRQLDEQLKILAIEAREYPAGSRQRRCKLTKLVQLIQTSGRLCRPYAGQFPHVYDDIYNEAIQMLFIYICDRIDSYAPDRGPVMRWVNFLLKRRFFNEAIPKIIGDRQEVYTDPVEPPPHVQKQLTTEILSPTLSEAIAQCLRDDPDGMFQEKSIRNSPHVTFREIALRRLDGETWKTISADLGVGISTLSDFYQRCMTQVAPLIKKYVQT